MSRPVDSEVFRQIALYAGVDGEELFGGMLLYDDLGLGPLTILMLLVTLGEVLGKDVLTLRFDLEDINTIDDLVALFSESAVGDMPRLSCCLH